MALLIKDNCINCDMCDPECPNEAIYFGEEIYEISADLCTECIGFYEKPTCMTVCPINCIIIDPENIESEQQLIDKFAELYS
ncbi:ferredoxin [Psychromonas sp. MB-3u-54]|uniref:YfhL family 4Fe-4S dicluster ferredoxin n=1 Tax=Psychromonas sp. MB-3u-54 TaxID=2058319 RepID=UPI000C32449D|nr:YfhL family 4Fe-4S dicluster ferredoxin [Psychromonas sp. MB-3u-54]PKH01661.1 ferredoxin [Psychromonas sp. MB-3u-54]